MSQTPILIGLAGLSCGLVVAAGWSDDVGTLPAAVFCVFAVPALFATLAAYRTVRSRSQVSITPPSSEILQPWIASLACSVLGILVCGWFGAKLVGLPPLYHDEYAYLFQAQTYRAGRLSWPTPALASDLRQMHVLTEPVWMSRYFPGMGLWLAGALMIPGVYDPSDPASSPALLPIGATSWLLHALNSGLAAWLAGRQTQAAGRGKSGALAAWLAGTSVAVAPGFVLFGNTLLSTLPTMSALLLFAALWQEWERKPRGYLAMACGLVMAFAFITRPVTAVGCGLVYGWCSAFQLLRPNQPNARRSVLIMAAAFLPGPLLVGCVNHLTLGDTWTTPYGLYTARFTPCHVYGFYNVTRGQSVDAPERLPHYDAWANELTPTGAVSLMGARILSAARWTVGVPFAALLGLMVLGALVCGRLRRSDQILLLSGAGLAAAYFPFAFEGILGFSYIAEAMPLILVVMARVMAEVVGTLVVHGRFGAATTWIVLHLGQIGYSLAVVIPLVLAVGSDQSLPRQRQFERITQERMALERLGPFIEWVDARPQDAVHSTLTFQHPEEDFLTSAPVIRVFAADEQVLERWATATKRPILRYRPNGLAEPATWTRIR